MTLPLWCLFITSLIPIMAAGTGSAARLKQPGGLDNKNPRQQIARLDGVGARAYAAQANAWEALALFTVAVVINHLAGGAAGPSGILAVLFVAARLGHLGAYLADQDKLRSISFAVAWLCCVGLVVLGALA